MQELTINESLGLTNKQIYEYLDHSSTYRMKLWMDDCCGFLEEPMLSHGTIEARELYESYLNWTLAGNEEFMNERMFHKQMAKHGYVTKFTDHGVFYTGIELINPIY
jgi:hypothetical protein